MTNRHSLIHSDTTVDAYARLPIAPLHAYYRSRLLTVKIATNPLVASAAALLAVAPRLRATKTYTDIHALYQHLSHEIRAFETNAQNQGYRSETIVVARYVLCTFLDESIASTKWAAVGGWDPYRLLNTFHKEVSGGERFFVILSRSSEDPTVHIDLLELMYFCLSLGYEGKYRTKRNRRAQLKKIRDDLYQRIRWQRGEIKKQLLIHCDSSVALPSPTLATETLPVWLIIILTATLLLTVYSGFNYLLTRKTITLYKELPTSILSQEQGHKNVSA
ncbi:MAG: type IVB secretion system protein IcmH/DotU [Gammaproteobacteria bacterium]